MDPAISTDFALLAAALEADLDALVADYVERLAVESPEWTSERPELAETIRFGAQQAIGAEVRALREGAVPQALPPTDAEGARQCARLGVPLHGVLLQYRLGHAVQWDAWMRLVEAHAAPPPSRRALLERASRFFFAYAGAMTELVIEEYSAERERILRGREQQRVALVRELLDGRDVDADALGYRPADHHLAVVASGDAAADAIGRLAETLGRRLFHVRIDADTSWGWIGGDDPLAAAAQRAVRRFAPPAGVHVGLGEPAPGAEGFRRSHREAWFAHAAAVRRREPALLFEDVSLEALATCDRDAARTFVSRELRGLDGDDARSRRLRATLRAYFASGQRAAGAAGALGVHQQTVAQRLQAVEERTGRSVASRSAELETALRLRRHLAG